MFATTFPAGPWQTNCYLLAPERGSDLTVVDPGVGAFERIAEFAEQSGVGVAGVLLTHGHIDHVASAADVAERWGVPAWLHPADRELLRPDALEPGTRAMVESLGVALREPSDLRDLADGQTVEVGGLSFGVIHAPGHRPGCVMLSLAADDGTLLFTGDVLFAGSIGRTDLPGGDSAVMRRTLRDVVLALPDPWEVHSGHGPATTIGAERATNPFLSDRPWRI